jgi:hypothetical protein
MWIQKKKPLTLPNTTMEQNKDLFIPKKKYKDELVIQKMNEKSSQPKISNFLNTLLISKKKKTRSTHEYE